MSLNLLVSGRHSFLSEHQPRNKGVVTHIQNFVQEENQFAEKLTLSNFHSIEIC